MYSLEIKLVINFGECTKMILAKVFNSRNCRSQDSLNPHPTLNHHLIRTCPVSFDRRYRFLKLTFHDDAVFYKIYFKFHSNK